MAQKLRDFLALRCVSWLGSGCDRVTVWCVWSTLRPHPDLDWCIFRPLAFLHILPQWHFASATPPSNVVCIVFLIVVLVLFRLDSSDHPGWPSHPLSSGGIVLYGVLYLDWCPLTKTVTRDAVPLHQSPVYSRLPTVSPVSPVFPGFHPVYSWPSKS